MNLNGYIKLHRKMMAWQWKSHPPTLCLFIHLLLSAAYEPDSKSGIPLLPGQISAGRRELARETGLSVQQVMTALSHLQSTGEISIMAVDRKYSVITIHNWAKYQLATSNPTSDPTSADTQEAFVNQGFQGFQQQEPNQQPNQQSSQEFNQSRFPTRFQTSNPTSDPTSADTQEAFVNQGFQGFQQQEPNQQPNQQSSQIPDQKPSHYIEENKEVKKKRKKKDIYSDENGWPQIGEYVWMPQKEYDTFVQKYGEPFARKCVEVLSHWKGSNGRKYVSDYQAMCGWVKDKVLREYPNLAKRQPQQQTLPETTTTQSSEWGDGI